jgi:hypothetical protein
MSAAMSTQPPLPPKARSLTQEAFASFLCWLSSSPEQAAREYLGIRSKLVRFFVHKGCAHDEELADQTLDRATIIVHNEPGKYNNPIALCCGVGRNIWLEYVRKEAPATLELNDVSAPPSHPADFSEQEATCLGSCLERLSARDRDLITQYHQFQGSEKIEKRKQMAEVYGGLNKLRITAHRIRVRLHDCIAGCVRQFAN